jgi:voltage-gated potassium channel
MKILQRIKDIISDIFFFIRHHEFTKILLILLLIITISVAGIYFFEAGKNDAFQTVFDTVWYTIVTLSTVGYGDKSPETVEGRLIGILIILFGVAVVGAVTGRIASFLVEKQLKAGQGLSSLKKLTGHFIICGYKSEIPRIVLDILKVNPELKMDNVVLISTVDPQRINDLKADKRFAKIKFIYGDYTDASVLIRANIKNAKTILVLSDYTNPSATTHEIDSRSVMAAMTIDSLTKEIYTCAELLDSKFEKYLELAHCDEIILSRDYGRIMLANASAATGVSHVVNEIIDVNSPTPVTIINFPDAYVGKKITELSEFILKKQGSILIGILEHTGNIFQRKKEVLQDAQKTPDISKLVENLQLIKRIKPNDPIINPGENYIIKKNSKAIVIPINSEYLKEQKNGKN